MRLPEDTTIYIGGKKYTRDMPDHLVPESVKSSKSDTKPLKKISKDKKDGE